MTDRAALNDCVALLRSQTFLTEVFVNSAIAVVSIVVSFGNLAHLLSCFGVSCHVRVYNVAYGIYAPSMQSLARHNSCDGQNMQQDASTVCIVDRFKRMGMLVCCGRPDTN